MFLVGGGVVRTHLALGLIYCVHTCLVWRTWELSYLGVVVVVVVVVAVAVAVAVVFFTLLLTYLVRVLTDDDCCTNGGNEEGQARRK